MSQKLRPTAGEQLFEAFCRAQSLQFERIPEGIARTPDYRIHYEGQTIAVEIKQIDADENFSSLRQSRKVGAHLRAKINSARGQLRTAAEDGHAALLLVVNNLDPLQLFGTESTDFLAAMYGDWVIRVGERGEILESGRGHNRYFRPDANRDFSGLGLLSRSRSGPTITVYENIHARWPLRILPEGMEFHRLGLTEASPMLPALKPHG